MDAPRGSSPVAPSDSATRADPTDAAGRSGPAVIVAAVFTVAPIWILAIRVGLRGLIPVGDTAVMALRVSHVLMDHPPLKGMPASSASAAEVVHFPAAWQIYWITGPIKLFGPIWGSVLSMALLNSIWLGLAIWLVRRNLPQDRALVVIGAIGVFCWSIGAGMFIDAWPLKMILVPFLCVVVAAWFTAAGDRAALIVLAVAANYAWLDHLVLGIAVPLVALTGCLGFLLGHLRANRIDPSGRDIRSRGFRRAVLGAGIVTAVMWLPALIEQATNSPGNLRLLLTGSEGAAPAIRSWTAAVHVVASVVGRPPFWFRGTLDDPAFYRAHVSGHAVGSATWYDLAVMAVLVGILVGSAVVTLRRRDRLGAALVAVTTTAVVASLVTTYLAPTTTALVPEYLHSVWVTGLLVWTCTVVIALRVVHPGPSPTAGWIGLGIAVAFGVANVPVSHTGYTTQPRENVLAHQMADTVMPIAKENQPVQVRLAGLYGNASYIAALNLQLERSGVSFCESTSTGSLYDFIPNCQGSQPKLVITERSTNDPPDGEVVFSEPVFPGKSADDVADIRARLDAWLSTRTSLTLSRAAQRPFLGDAFQQLLRSQVEHLEPVDGNLSHLLDSTSFRKIITMWWRLGDARDADLFVDQPVSSSELYRWARTTQDAESTLWVTFRR